MICIYCVYKGNFAGQIPPLGCASVGMTRVDLENRKGGSRRSPYNDNGKHTP
ncbi:MAG: hypothetical protein GY845_21395 [Planctomycetes bacterium]|nr:hypothetical protein [Planctomycetota bacterium]